MPTAKFSQLVAAVLPAVSDVVALVNGAATKKLTFAQLRAFLGMSGGVTTLEAHGAVGDGVTDATAAITDVAADNVAGSATDLQLELEAKTYLTTGTNPWPFGLSIFGRGPKSVVKSTTNAAIIAMRDADAADRQKATTWAFFSMLGDGKATGKTSQDAFRSGYFGVDGSSRTTFISLYAKDIGGFGIISAYSDKAGTGQVNAFCILESCYTGMSAQEGESHGIRFFDCTTGLTVGGNHVILGCQFEGCTLAYTVSAGGNDAHGACVGTSWTHNTTAIDIGATTNGQYFIGCRLFDGAITLGANTHFHLFSGCVLAATTWTFNGTKARLLDCVVGKQTGGYFASATFTNSQIEMRGVRDEDGLIPPWVGQNNHPLITYASNADKTLSLQEGWGEVIEVANGAFPSAPVNLICQRTPSRGETQRLINRSTQPVHYFWASGTGITAPPGKTIDIDFGYDGVNMACTLIGDNTAASVARP